MAQTNLKTDTLNFDAKVLGYTQEFISGYRKEINKIVDDAAEDALKDVAVHSPQYRGLRTAGYRKGHKGRPYAKGWIVDGRSGYRVILNKNKPSLTHFFLSGTEKRETARGYNRGGMSSNGHMENAFKRGYTYMEREIKKL